MIRRWSFQIHLWTGLVTGLYLALMSVTGSAIVFRGEIGRLLTPMPRIVPSGSRRTCQQLIANADPPLITGEHGRIPFRPADLETIGR